MGTVPTPTVIKITATRFWNDAVAPMKTSDWFRESGLERLVSSTYRRTDGRTTSGLARTCRPRHHNLLLAGGGLGHFGGCSRSARLLPPRGAFASIPDSEIQSARKMGLVAIPFS